MNKIKLLIITGLSALALPVGASSIYIAPKATTLAEPIQVVGESSQIDNILPKDAAQGDDGMVASDIQGAGGKTAYESFSADSASRVLPTVNKKTESSASRLLPTVNKKTGESSERVLPTVNKREAKVIVRGWDAEKKEQIDNLGKNIKSVTDADENIASAEVSKDKVEVVYRREAKLFGFLPVAYFHAFTVDEKGNVSNGKPWWLMFASSDADQFGSDVDAIYQHYQTDLRYIKMPTPTEEQLQRFNSLSNVLKTKHDTVKNSINNIR